MNLSGFINNSFLPKRIKLDTVGLTQHTVENEERCREIVLLNAISVEKDYTVVAFYATKDGEKTIYAYLYIYEDKPEFVCYTGPLVSMDGEFRNKFISFIQWEEFYSYKNILERLESVLDAKSNQNFEFTSFGSDITPKMTKYIEESKIGFQLFTTS
jgi:hypothetical protein